MTAKHTPTKWKVDSSPIQQAARDIVAYYHGEAWKWKSGEWEKAVAETASLIVHAGNNFEELVLMCEDVLARLEACGYGGSNLAAEHEHEKRLRSLISKAKKD
jgi:hypothetical protein